MRHYRGKTLYLECNSGISGDMTVAALLDLGADKEELLKVLDSLGLDGYEIEISRVKKAGIACCDFHVHLDASHENHDHDMQYLHGDNHEHEGHHHEEKHRHEAGRHHEEEHRHEAGHHHGEEHHHEAGHHHEEGHHHHEEGHCHEGHHHEHRGLAEITQIIDSGNMSDNARILAKKIFGILAEAEAKAHEVPVEEVHFHEVGAVDSIIDIVAAAVCLDNLGVEEVVVSRLCEGHGTVRCQHGILPVPVPAVANILSAYELNVEFMDVEGEFLTPTGAAIVAAVKTGDKLPKSCKIEKIGLGAGKREYERPSILRAMLLNDMDMQKDEEETKKDTIYKLESNIDDCTGEALGFVMEQLFAAGARDVHYMPVFMKKNRPGWQLNVICKEADISRLEQIIFRETTTIGVRRVEMERSVLKREIKEVKTTFGNVKVKVCETDEGVRYYPEYESVAEISRQQHLPYLEVYQQIVEMCRK